MKLTIESTPEIVYIDGVRCRTWTASLPSGDKVQVFVHRIVAPVGPSAAELERELRNVANPRHVVQEQHPYAEIDLAARNGPSDAD